MTAQNENKLIVSIGRNRFSVAVPNGVPHQNLMLKLFEQAVETMGKYACKDDELLDAINKFSANSEKTATTLTNAINRIDNKVNEKDYIAGILSDRVVKSYEHTAPDSIIAEDAIVNNEECAAPEEEITPGEEEVKPTAYETSENNPVEVPKKEPEPERKGYRGFLYIKCDHCGNLHPFSKQEPVTEYHCPKCEKTTELIGLKVLTVDCPRCGGKFYYYTNQTEKMFDISCLSCKAPVPIAYNVRQKVYRTIRE